MCEGQLYGCHGINQAVFPQSTPEPPQVLQSWSADKWLWPPSPFEAESDPFASANVELPVEEFTSPVLRRSGQDCQQQGCSPSYRNPFTRHAIFSEVSLPLHPSTPGWLLPHHSNSSAGIWAPEEKQFRIFATDSSITVESMDSQSEGTNEHSPLVWAEVMPLPRHGHGSLLITQPIGPGSLAHTVFLHGVGGAGMGTNRQKTRQTNALAELWSTLASVLQLRDCCLQGSEEMVPDGHADRTGFPFLAVACPHTNPIPWGTEKKFLARQLLTLLPLNGFKNDSLYNPIASFHFTSI